MLGNILKNSHFLFCISLSIGLVGRVHKVKPLESWLNHLLVQI